MSDHEEDLLARDPRIAELLRQAEGDAGLDASGRSALRARIIAGAELPLARLRAESAGSRAAAGERRRSLRAVAPLAAAAVLATLLWLGIEGRGGGSGERPELAEIDTLEEAFVADLSEQEFRAFVSGRSNPEELLLLAAGEG